MNQFSYVCQTYRARTVCQLTLNSVCYKTAFGNSVHFIWEFGIRVLQEEYLCPRKSTQVVHCGRGLSAREKMIGCAKYFVKLVFKLQK